MSGGEDEWGSYDSEPRIARLESEIEDALEARDKWHSIAHKQKLENERLHALIEEFATFCVDSGWHNVAEQLRARAARCR